MMSPEYREEQSNPRKVANNTMYKVTLQYKDWKLV